MTTALAELPDVLTAEEAAGFLQCSTWLVYDLVKKGQLAGLRLGRLVRIPKAELARFIGAEREEAGPAAGPPSNSRFPSVATLATKTAPT
jgi:excisionase family DNA binding protein